MSDLRHRFLRSVTPLRDRGVSAVAVRKRPSMVCHDLHLGPALGSPWGLHQVLQIEVCNTSSINLQHYCRSPSGGCCRSQGFKNPLMPVTEPAWSPCVVALPWLRHRMCCPPICNTSSINLQHYCRSPSGGCCGSQVEVASAMSGGTRSYV